MLQICTICIYAPPGENIAEDVERRSAASKASNMKDNQLVNKTLDAKP
jgi:hypothetical protein